MQVAAYRQALSSLGLLVGFIRAHKSAQEQLRKHMKVCALLAALAIKQLVFFAVRLCDVGGSTSQSLWLFLLLILHTFITHIMVHTYVHRLRWQLWRRGKKANRHPMTRWAKGKSPRVPAQSQGQFSRWV